MRTKQIFTSMCAAVLLSTAALAQSNSAGSGLMDVTKLANQTVTNNQDQNLGHISQILVDPQSGRLRYAVLEVDKLWQMDDPQIAVPWGALNITRQGDTDFTVKLDATKEKLQGAPRYKVGDATRLFTKQASQPVYTYWSIIWLDDPAAPSGNEANVGAETLPNPPGNSATKPTGTATPDGANPASSN